MIKALIFSILIVVPLAGRCQSKRLPADSLKKAIQTSIDLFKPSSADYRHFRKSNYNYQSDLLKPTPATVPDTLLLKDSLFVREYRNAAYAKIRNRRSTGHHFLVGGTIAISAMLVATVVTLGVLLHKTK